MQMKNEVAPGQFRARMIDHHRRFFKLWGRCHEVLERCVTVPRDISQPYARALDILFVEAFKSHGSIYVLLVRGHGECAATILRRLLEIAFQVGYLADKPSSRQDRAERYLAWFWCQAHDRVRAVLPRKEKAWWQVQYHNHKHLILDASGKPFRNWWGKGSIRDLAVALNLADTYDRDYKFLCQFAHCTSQGLLLERRGSNVEIRTDLLVADSRFWDEVHVGSFREVE
jgi:hypothetical protein